MMALEVSGKLRKEWSRGGTQCAVIFHMAGFGRSDSIVLSSLKSSLTPWQLFPFLGVTSFFITLFGRGGSVTGSLQLIFPVK